MTSFITIITSLFFVVSNYFPNLFEGGRQISEISNNLIVTPSGYAFSIWFPIFVGCLLFARTALRNWYSKNLLIGMSTVFFLLGVRTTIVSFTDLYWLPPIMFVVASIILLYTVKELRKIPQLQEGWKYWCILIPLFMFVGWSNSAFRLNFGTVFTQYGSSIDPIIVGILVLIGLAVWQYTTTIWFRLPLTTLFVYLWATIAIVAALISQGIQGVLLRVAILHTIGLSIVSYLAICKKQY